MRLLILGGTSEASALARRLAGRSDISATLSLAGRTGNPIEPPIPLRVGGFGGADGLAAFLADGGIDAMVDATHPFAARISANAVAAATRIDVPLTIFTRPPWEPRDGDDWHRVPDLDAAASALGERRRGVFVTSGRLGLAAFRRAPQHRYLVRSIDPPAVEDRPPDCEVVLARGPFDAAEEEALMRRHGIEILVSKNSGGRAAAAKLEAARTLRLPVVMVERPAATSGVARFHDVDGVLAWIERHRRAP